MGTDLYETMVWNIFKENLESPFLLLKQQEMVILKQYNL